MIAVGEGRGLDPTITVWGVGVGSRTRLTGLGTRLRTDWMANERHLFAAAQNALCDRAHRRSD